MAFAVYNIMMLLIWQNILPIYFWQKSCFSFSAIDSNSMDILVEFNAVKFCHDVHVCVTVVKEPLDYQGRSFMHVPQDVGVNLRSAEPPARCFLPKKLIHTWTGHNKGIHAIRWLPSSAHLLLSCSMDSKIKVCFCSSHHSVAR